MTKFRTAYDDSYVSPPLMFLDDKGKPEVSLTLQSEAEATDINNIVARYEETGILPSATMSPLYGDFSVPFDFQTAQNALVSAQNAFMALPAKVRERFNNSPANLIAFIEDKDTTVEELRKLGLATPEQASPVPTSQAPPDVKPASKDAS